MGKRGRKSAAELAMTPVVEIQPRPVAPDELTDEEAREWEVIVARMPGSWLTREQHPILMQFCRHTVAARRLSQLIHQAEGQEMNWEEDRWLRLQRAQAQQSAVLAGLATKMRITHQSRYGPRAAATEAQIGGDGPKPWED